MKDALLETDIEWFSYYDVRGIDKYGKDGQSKAIPGHSLMLAALGVFILWFSWFGFNPGSQLATATSSDQTAISHVFLTTNLTAPVQAVSLRWR